MPPKFPAWRLARPAAAGGVPITTIPPPFRHARQLSLRAVRRPIGKRAQDTHGCGPSCDANGCQRTAAPQDACRVQRASHRRRCAASSTPGRLFFRCRCGRGIHGPRLGPKLSHPRPCTHARPSIRHSSASERAIPQAHPGRDRGRAGQGTPSPVQCPPLGRPGAHLAPFADVIRGAVRQAVGLESPAPVPSACLARHLGRARAAVPVHLSCRSGRVVPAGTGCAPCTPICSISARVHRTVRSSQEGPGYLLCSRAPPILAFLSRKPRANPAHDWADETNTSNPKRRA